VPHRALGPPPGVWPDSALQAPRDDGVEALARGGDAQALLLPAPRSNPAGPMRGTSRPSDLEDAAEQRVPELVGQGGLGRACASCGTSQGEITTSAASPRDQRGPRDSRRRPTGGEQRERDRHDERLGDRLDQDRDARQRAEQYVGQRLVLGGVEHGSRRDQQGGEPGRHAVQPAPGDDEGRDRQDGTERVLGGRRGRSSSGPGIQPTRKANTGYPGTRGSRPGTVCRGAGRAPGAGSPACPAAGRTGSRDS
jgi:hypothetical protein